MIPIPKPGNSIEIVMQESSKKGGWEIPRIAGCQAILESSNVHFTLPETNSEFTPKNRCLECFLSYWGGLFSVVSFKEGSQVWTSEKYEAVHEKLLF